MAEYRIDPASGTLTVVNPALITQNLATFSFRDPAHNFLYVIGSPKNPNPDFSTLVISGNAVDQSTGAVTPTPGSPFGVPQQELSFTTVRPDRKFAYVDDALSATILHIVAMDPGSGALLQEVGTVTITGSQNASNMAHGTFDSSGHFLYIINAENNNVAGYTSDPVTGMLTPVPGSPFSPHGAVPTGCSPKANFCGGALAVSGNHLYYTSELFPGTAEFNIDPATGILTEAPGSPFPAPQPGFTAITTPSGKFLYVTAPSDFGPGNLILGYAIDPVTGALTSVPGSPYSTTGNDVFADMDESGQFFYTSSGGSIVGYRIDQGTGALTLVPGSPFPTTGITGLTIVH